MTHLYSIARRCVVSAGEPARAQDDRCSAGRRIQGAQARRGHAAIDEDNGSPPGSSRPEPTTAPCPTRRLPARPAPAPPLPSTPSDLHPPTGTHHIPPLSFRVPFPLSPHCVPCAGPRAGSVDARRRWPVPRGPLVRGVQLIDPIAIGPDNVLVGCEALIQRARAIPPPERWTMKRLSLPLAFTIRYLATRFG